MTTMIIFVGKKYELMNSIKFIVFLSIFMSWDLHGQICPMCSKERLVTLLNSNPLYKDYEVKRHSDMPDEDIYWAENDEWIMVLNLNVKSNSVDEEMHYAKTSYAHNLIYNTFKRDKFKFEKYTDFGDMYILDYKIMQILAFVKERNEYGYCQIRYSIIQH